jgi:membrane dipeptidase
LLNLLLPERGGGRDFFESSEHGHVDHPRMRLGGMAGGFFAMFTPTPDEREKLTFTSDGYEVQLASAVDHAHAVTLTNQMFDLLDSLADPRNGQFRIALDAATVRESIAKQIAFAIPHIEGAEAIAPDLSNLAVFYERGMRSLGLVWSRPNAFGHGVPYIFPRTPDIGPGLTDAGTELVRACNDLGVMLDLSHLNLAGFQDVARISRAPLVATHSGVHRICPVTRNLTDEQIDAIGASNGVIGIPFDVTMIRPDGWLERETPLDRIVDHIDYIAERIGIEHVAFGSDFDGAVMPYNLSDAAALQHLVACMRTRGYDDDSLERVAHRNWTRVLEETLGLNGSS